MQVHIRKWVEKKKIFQFNVLIPYLLQDSTINICIGLNDTENIHSLPCEHVGPNSLKESVLCDDITAEIEVVQVYIHGLLQLRISE